MSGCSQSAVSQEKPSYLSIRAEKQVVNRGDQILQGLDW